MVFRSFLSKISVVVLCCKYNVSGILMVLDVDLHSLTTASTASHVALID